MHRTALQLLVAGRRVLSAALPMLPPQWGRTRMIRMTSAASSTQRAKQVRQSAERAAGTTPAVLTYPTVPLSPTQPLKPAGMRPAAQRTAGHSWGAMLAALTPPALQGQDQTAQRR